MLLLDTHVWVWSVHQDPRLKATHKRLLESSDDEIAVSAISCWEISKLVSLGRLVLDRSLAQWFDDAIGVSGVKVIELSPAVAIEANSLPGNFHRDPADQIIVATARIHSARLLTSDERILKYSHVDAL